MGIGKLVEIEGFVDCVHDNDFVCMGTGGVFSFVEFSIQIWKFGCQCFFHGRTVAWLFVVRGILGFSLVFYSKWVTRVIIYFFLIFLIFE